MTSLCFVHLYSRQCQIPTKTRVFLLRYKIIKWIESRTKLWMRLQQTKSTQNEKDNFHTINHTCGKHTFRTAGEAETRNHNKDVKTQYTDQIRRRRRRRSWREWKDTHPALMLSSSQPLDSSGLGWALLSHWDRATQNHMPKDWKKGGK